MPQPVRWGISRPMVSRYLEQMEKWAGTRLVNRSTRKLTLTAAGEKVLQKTRTLSQLSQEIEGQSEKDLPSRHLTGSLRALYRHAHDCAGTARAAGALSAAQN